MVTYDMHVSGHPRLGRTGGEARGEGHLPLLNAFKERSCDGVLVHEGTVVLEETRPAHKGTYIPVYAA